VVPERWVLNASRLIVLAGIHRKDLIFSLAEEVVVPRAVALEIEAGPEEDEARHLLASDSFTLTTTCRNSLRAGPIASGFQAR